MTTEELTAGLMVCQRRLDEHKRMLAEAEQADTELANAVTRLAERDELVTLCAQWVLAQLKGERLAVGPAEVRRLEGLANGR